MRQLGRHAAWSITYRRSPLNSQQSVGTTGLNHFHLFGPLKKHLDGKEVCNRRRREASRRLRAPTIDTVFFYAGIEALAPTDGYV